MQRDWDLHEMEKHDCYSTRREFYGLDVLSAISPSILQRDSKRISEASMLFPRNAWPVASTMLLFAAVLFGCSGTIFERANMDSGESFFIDARQRMVSNVSLEGKQFTNGQITPRRIVCAEPSPDVALAMARSLGAGVNVLSYGSGSASAATSEALAQLGERFAAVQLLRDILYRSCEAYANGAISNTTYALMMARLDETTTTLLLGEMAAGAFGRQLGAAQASSESKTTTSLVESRNTPPRSSDGAKTGNGTPSPATAPSSPAGATPVTRQSDGTTGADVKATATVPAGTGTIATRSAAGEVAGEVAKIHKAFLDDDNLDALLVACITSLSHEDVKDGKSSTETSLSSICKTQIFNRFIENVKDIIAAKANAEVVVSRARNEAAYVDAINRCIAIFGNDSKQTCAPLIAAVPSVGPSPRPTPVSVKQ
jgi:hypothetical protein